MATTVTLRLSNNAHTFNAEKSTGFAIRGGVKYYDRDSKKDEWTNYEAVVFASSPAQIDYYTQNLVEGAVVEVSATKLKVKAFNGQNGQKLSIELLNAELGLVAQAMPRDNKQQGGYQQPQGGHSHQPQGGYQQPQGGYQRPQSGHRQPQGGYQRPQSGHQQPQGGYQRPQSGHQQPQGGYQQPQGGYQQPQGGYPNAQGNFQDQ